MEEDPRRLETEWIGYRLDVQPLTVGISKARVRWVMSWIEKIITDRHVLVSTFREGLGRLGFVEGPLEQLRPFLGPMYAWSSASSGGGYGEVPMLV